MGFFMDTAVTQETLFKVGLPGQTPDCFLSETSSRSPSPYLQPQIAVLDYEEVEQEYIDFSRALIQGAFSLSVIQFLELASKAVVSINNLESQYAKLSYRDRKSESIFQRFSQHREALNDILAHKLPHFEAFCLQNTDIIESTEMDPSPFVATVVKKLLPVLKFMGKTSDVERKAKVKELKQMVKTYFKMTSKIDDKKALRKIGRSDSAFLSFRGL